MWRPLCYHYCWWGVGIASDHLCYVCIPSTKYTHSPRLLCQIDWDKYITCFSSVIPAGKGNIISSWATLITNKSILGRAHTFSPVWHFRNTVKLNVHFFLYMSILGYLKHQQFYNKFRKYKWMFSWFFPPKMKPICLFDLGTPSAQTRASHANPSLPGTLPHGQIFSLNTCISCLFFYYYAPLSHMHSHS